MLTSISMSFRNNVASMIVTLMMNMMMVLVTSCSHARRRRTRPDTGIFLQLFHPPSMNRA